MRHKKKCSGCQYWTKAVFSDQPKGSGICNLIDLRCSSGYGCEMFKAKPYDRINEKIKIKQEIENEILI